MLTRDYCSNCRQDQPHEVTTTNHALHLIATLFTAGFWLPIWVIMAIGGTTKNCRVCGTKKKTAADFLMKVVMCTIGGIVGLIVLGVVFSSCVPRR